MIEFRPLTKDEAQSATHFCGRCDTFQKRFALHHCTPTEAWKAAKAAMLAKNPMPPPYTKQTLETPVADEPERRSEGGDE